ncbi:MAG: hypothetical protein R3F61_20050 [Myxococcota bacterium]
MDTENDPSERERLSRELEDATRELAEQKARQNRMEQQLRRTKTDTLSVERRMARAMERLYGVRVDLGSIDEAIGEPHERQDTPMSRTLNALAHFEDGADVGDPNAEEDAWVPLLRTSKQKNKWAKIHLVRRALESCGGRARIAELFEAVEQQDPNWSQRSLSSFIGNSSHFARCGKHWCYVPGPPELTDRQVRTLRRYRMLAGVIEEKGGRAYWADMHKVACSHPRLELRLSEGQLGQYLDNRSPLARNGNQD